MSQSKGGLRTDSLWGRTGNDLPCHLQKLLLTRDTGIELCKLFFKDSAIFTSSSKALRGLTCRHHLRTSAMNFLWQCRKTCTMSFPSSQSFPLSFFPSDTSSLFPNLKWGILSWGVKDPHTTLTPPPPLSLQKLRKVLALNSVLVTLKINLSNL